MEHTPWPSKDVVSATHGSSTGLVAPHHEAIILALKSPCSWRLQLRPASTDRRSRLCASTIAVCRSGSTPFGEVTFCRSSAAERSQRRNSSPAPDTRCPCSASRARGRAQLRRQPRRDIQQQAGANVGRAVRLCRDRIDRPPSASRRRPLSSKCVTRRSRSDRHPLPDRSWRCRHRRTTAVPTAADALRDWQVCAPAAIDSSARCRSPRQCRQHVVDDLRLLPRGAPQRRWRCRQLRLMAVPRMPWLAISAAASAWCRIR